VIRFGKDWSSSCESNIVTGRQESRHDRVLSVQYRSDVKRGQNLEAETEAEARVLRPRPRSRPEL